MNAHNTFAQPQRVTTVSFDACKVTDQGFAATLPAKSVVVSNWSRDRGGFQATAGRRGGAEGGAPERSQPWIDCRS